MLLLLLLNGSSWTWQRFYSGDSPSKNQSVIETFVVFIESDTVLYYREETPHMGCLHRCDDHVSTGLKPVQHVAADFPRGCLVNVMTVIVLCLVVILKCLVVILKCHVVLLKCLVVILKCLVVLPGAVPPL